MFLLRNKKITNSEYLLLLWFKDVLWLSKNHFIEMVLLSTHRISFSSQIRKLVILVKSA